MLQQMFLHGNCIWSVDGDSVPGRQNIYQVQRPNSSNSLLVLVLTSDYDLVLATFDTPALSVPAEIW
jgi:hypothetical protein